MLFIIWVVGQLMVSFWMVSWMLVMLWFQNIVQVIVQQVKCQVGEQDCCVGDGGDLLLVENYLYFVGNYCFLFCYWWVGVQVEKIEFGGGKDNICQIECQLNNC